MPYRAPVRPLVLALLACSLLLASASTAAAARLAPQDDPHASPPPRALPRARRVPLAFAPTPLSRAVDPLAIAVNPVQWLTIAKSGVADQFDGGMAIDSRGDLVLAGTTGDGESLDSFSDMSIQSWTRAGTRRWFGRYSSPDVNDHGALRSDDRGSDVAVDVNDDVVAVGQGIAPDGKGDSDPTAVVQRFSAAGTLRWTRVLTGRLNGTPQRVAIDAQGNAVVVAGEWTEGGSHDVLLAKFDPAGRQLWRTRWGSAGYEMDWPVDIAVNPDGAILMTAQSYAGDNTTADFSLTKLSPEGATLWSRRYDHGVADSPASLAIDAAGSTCVVGYGSRGASDEFDAVAVCYSTAGVRVWARTLSGDADNNGGYAVAAHPSGGFVIGTVLSYSGQGEWLEYDIGASKVTTSGVEEWRTRLGMEIYSDTPGAILTDARGRVFVAGQLGDGSQAVFALAANGSRLWDAGWSDGPVISLGESPGPRAYPLAIDQDGAIYAASSGCDSDAIVGGTVTVRIGEGTGADGAAPRTSFAANPSWPPSVGRYSEPPVLTLSTGEYATTYYQWDSTSPGGWQTYSAPITAQPGLRRLYFRSVDPFGNAEQPRVRTFDSLRIEEVSGATRFETAVEASKKAFPGGAGAVVVATARNWPDALGGTALAGALDAPVLLVERDSVPAAIAAEVRRLGATRAYILGGEPAVSRGVYAQLEGLVGAGRVQRLGGADRYATARVIAAEAVKSQGGAFSGTAFVSTGANFPDALAASPLSAATGWPLYLTQTSSIAAATLDAMESAGVRKVVVLGSESVVSAAVVNALKARFGTDAVERVYGATRYGTAAAVARYGSMHAGLTFETPGIATGVDFPDALAGGVMLGSQGRVLLLNPPASASAESAAELAANRAELRGLCFLGRTTAVTQGARDALVRAAY